jgi:arginase
LKDKQVHIARKIQENPKLSIIGVPTNSSGKSDGVAKAPSAVRRAGLIQVLYRYCEIYDEGDVTFTLPITDRDPDSGIIGYGAFISMVQAVYKSVNNALKNHRFPLVIGGDCPILLGCLAAVKEIHGSSSGLIFVDGHEDAYPPYKSLTGEAADMELGFALGMNCEHLLSNIIDNNNNWPPLPLVDARNICMLCPRDKKVLQKQGVESLSSKVVEIFYDDTALRKSKNIEALINRTLKQLKSKTLTVVDKLWLHVDLDVLSTRSMPAVDYQQPGGINWNQLKKITKAIMSSGYTIGLNLTIYNPDMDPEGLFAKRIVNYLGYAISLL